jgi:hypothetical protein
VVRHLGKGGRCAAGGARARLPDVQPAGGDRAPRGGRARATQQQQQRRAHPPLRP